MKSKRLASHATLLSVPLTTGSASVAIRPRVASSKSCLSFSAMALRTTSLAAAVTGLAGFGACCAMAGMPANNMALSVAVMGGVLAFIGLVSSNGFVGNRCVAGDIVWPRPALDAPAGAHTITVVDTQGNRLSRNFEVPAQDRR